jgi:regulator of protease activity HflC (stomatin/prohibitin superfamily)
MKTIRLALQGITLVALGVFSTGCFKQIPPSSVGIKFNASNGISEKLIKPQVTFVGLRQRLIIYPTSIKNASYVRNTSEGERQGDDSVQASTVEGATLPVDVTVAWHVDPANVVKAFENFGTEDLDEIQRTFIRSTAIYGVNIVSGQRSIFDLTSKERSKFGPEVKKIISPILENMGLSVDDVYIGEVYPSGEIMSKVSERVAKRNELEQAIIGLQQAKIDATTTLTNAKKQAELNALLAQQGDKAIQIKRLENQRRAIAAWDGQPSQMGDGTIPFTNINPRDLAGSAPDAATPKKQ